MPRVAGAGLIRNAFASGYAIPAFNVANLETAQAVVGAAEQCGSPVILQISPGAIAYAGYESIAELSCGAADRASVPVLVHLDHCRDPEVVRQAFKDGFGSVMFDGSRLGDAENRSLTRVLVVEAAAFGVAVEGEPAYIGGSEDTTLDQARGQITSPAEAAAFVMATGVDVLAPALGTLHRMQAGTVELDIEGIRRVAAACRRPLALHGGSGVVRSQLRAAAQAGIAKVNVSSQVSRALAIGIRRFWDAEPEEHDLRRFLAAGRDEITRLAQEYMLLCGSAGRVAEVSAGATDERITEPE